MVQITIYIFIFPEKWKKKYMNTNWGLKREKWMNSQPARVGNSSVSCDSVRILCQGNRQLKILLYIGRERERQVRDKRDQGSDRIGQRQLNTRQERKQLVGGGRVQKGGAHNRNACTTAKTTTIQTIEHNLSN